MLLLFLLLAQCLLYLLSSVLPGTRQKILACGIFGFSGENPADNTAIRWLGVLNMSRGRSSTGVFTIGSDKGKTQTLFKEACDAEDFIMKLGFTQAITGATSIVGHTRASTSGATNQYNAHPFDSSVIMEGSKVEQKARVVGAHNGFVLQQIAKKYGFDKEFPVDSMLIFAMLSKYGGDYKCLPEIEGGIVAAFMVPDKYPDCVYLYKREARDLHFGRKREGIYYSSEKKPLELIGCEFVTPLRDNAITILRHGEVVDCIDVDRPKIIVPLLAGRDNWHQRIPKEELNKITTIFPELKQDTTETVTKYSNYERRGEEYHSMGGKQHKIGFQPESFRPLPKENDTLEIIGHLVQHIKHDIGYITSKMPPIPTEQECYTPGDIDCGVVILKLISSKGDNDLPGWMVVDNMDDQIAGATALNGVTALKYIPMKCGNNRVIIIADPVEGKTKWEYTVKPEMGRVLEVTLQLPFPQEEKVQPTNTERSAQECVRAEIAERGGRELSLLSPNTKLHGSLCELDGANKGTLPWDLPQVCERPESGEISRVTKDGEGNLSVSEPTGGTQVHGSPVSIPLALTKKEIAKIFLNEYQSMDQKPTVKKWLSTPQYSKFCAFLEKRNIHKIISLSRIGHDSILLKQKDIETYGRSWDLGHYAMRILELFEVEYLMNKESKEDKWFVKNLVLAYKNGTFNNDLPIMKIVDKEEKTFEIAAYNKETQQYEVKSLSGMPSILKKKKTDWIDPLVRNY